MKKIVRRRKFFRVNNPLSFGILCAMILIFIAGATYALAAGVISPAVRSYRDLNSTPTIAPTDTPAPTSVPTPTPTPEIQQAEESPDPNTTPVPSGKPLSTFIIGIDPARSYSSKIQGVSTKIYANRLNYSIATLVKNKLEELGATVIFSLSDVRDTTDSAGRAKLMNSSNVDFVLRLECNFVNSKSTHGAIMWVPASHPKQEECEQLATAVLKSYIAATGLSVAAFEGQSIRHKDDQVILNQTEAPIAILIMGYISNAEEDLKLNDGAFQQTMSDGIVNGIMAYLGIAQ